MKKWLAVILIISGSLGLMALLWRRDQPFQVDFPVEDLTVGQPISYLAAAPDFSSICGFDEHNNAFLYDTSAKMLTIFGKATTSQVSALFYLDNKNALMFSLDGEIVVINPNGMVLVHKESVNSMIEDAHPIGPDQFLFIVRKLARFCLYHATISKNGAVEKTLLHEDENPFIRVVATKEFLYLLTETSCRKYERDIKKNNKSLEKFVVFPRPKRFFVSDDDVFLFSYSLLPLHPFDKKKSRDLGERFLLRINMNTKEEEFIVNSNRLKLRCAGLRNNKELVLGYECLGSNTSLVRVLDARTCAFLREHTIPRTIQGLLFRKNAIVCYCKKNEGGILIELAAPE